MTILHSLWQGAILVIMMNLYLRYHHNETPGFRYNVGFATIMIMLMTTLSTYLYYEVSMVGDHITTANATGQGVAGSVGSIFRNSPEAAISISSFVPLIGFVWLIGVLILSFKLSLNFIQLRNIKKSLVVPVPRWLQDQLDELSLELKVAKHVALGISNQVLSPLVIGYFKPIIIFPVATLNKLTPAETELILRHELGHILRNDFLHNIILRVAEVLLFYHPAARWTIALVERERENHCDDYAVTNKSQRISYAKTLVKVKELEAFQNQSLALAFSNDKKSLLKRVTRILNHNNKMSIMKSNLIVLAVLISSVICVSARSYYVNKKAPETAQVEKKSIEKLLTSSADAFIRPIVTQRDTSKEELESLIKLKEKEMKKMEKELRKLKKKNGADKSFHMHIDSDDWDEEEWEAFGQKMEEMGERIAAKFESEEWQEKMNNLGERISEKFESKEFEQKMEDLGERLSEKFESEEWEEKMERIGKKIELKVENGDFEGDMEEFGARMEELGDRLAETFESEEFHDAIEGIAIVGADLGVNVAETAIDILASLADIEGDIDIDIDEKDWDRFGDNLQNTIEEILDEVDSAMEDLDIDLSYSDSDLTSLVEVLQDELKEDGFYNRDKVSLELNKGKFRINGKTQSYQMEDKYKAIILDSFDIDEEDVPFLEYKFSDKKGKTKNSYSLNKEGSNTSKKQIKRF